MNIDFPFHFDGRGRTAATDDDDHIRDMIEQLLFTSPGRAGEPARLRQRPAADGVRAQQPRARRGAAVHPAGRAPALARRRDRGPRSSRSTSEDATLQRRSSATSSRRTGADHAARPSPGSSRMSARHAAAGLQRRRAPQEPVRQPALERHRLTSRSADDQLSLCVHFFGDVPDGVVEGQRAHRGRPPHPRHPGRRCRRSNRAVTTRARRLPAHHPRQVRRLLHLPALPGRSLAAAAAEQPRRRVATRRTADGGCR